MGLLAAREDAAVKCPVHKVKGLISEPGTAPPIVELNLDARYCTSHCNGNLAPSILAASSRILLIGTGADELLGGYGRHRTARVKRGAEGVHSETLKDLQRLWTRNV